MVISFNIFILILYEKLYILFLVFSIIHVASIYQSYSFPVDVEEALTSVKWKVRGKDGWRSHQNLAEGLHKLELQPRGAAAPALKCSLYKYQYSLFTARKHYMMLLVTNFSFWISKSMMSLRRLLFGR